MTKLFIVVLGALAAFAAEDAWTKVTQLKTGAELRILKKGSKQPIIAKMDEADAERIVVVIKNEQKAIPKDDIDQIDVRPLQTGSRMTKETKTTTNDNAAPSPGNPHAVPGPTTSSSSNVTFGSKPDFETIYRRSTVPPRK